MGQGRQSRRLKSGDNRWATRTHSQLEPKRTQSHQSSVVEALHLVLVHILVTLLCTPGPHEGVRARAQTLRKDGLACHVRMAQSAISSGFVRVRKCVLCSASSNSESSSPSSPSSSINSPIVDGLDLCFRLDTLSNDLRTVPGPSSTPSAMSEPRATRLPSPICTPAPMMQLSRTQLGPIVTSSKIYAFRKTVVAPIEQRAPMVDAVTCASSRIRVDGPISVLLPILHVLQDSSDGQRNLR
jgi:hypothetical protein